MKRLLLLPALAVVALACSSSDLPPEDLTGSYTIAVTNRENGCNFQNWTVGQSSSNIPFTITQQGSNGVTGTVGGAAGAYLDLVMATHTFTGSVSGPTGTMTATGARSLSQGNCAYTLNANAVISLSGNTINGSITYVPQTNKGSDCGVLNTCTTRQELSGNRPPK